MSVSPNCWGVSSLISYRRSFYLTKTLILYKVHINSNGVEHDSQPKGNETMPLFQEQEQEPSTEWTRYRITDAAYIKYSPNYPTVAIVQKTNIRSGQGFIHDGRSYNVNALLRSTFDNNQKIFSKDLIEMIKQKIRDLRIDSEGFVDD